MFAVGDKTNMDVYSDIVNKLHDISKNHPHTCLEETLEEYLRRSGIRVRLSWLYDRDINILRRATGKF